MKPGACLEPGRQRRHLQQRGQQGRAVRQAVQQRLAHGVAQDGQQAREVWLLSNAPVVQEVHQRLLNRPSVSEGTLGRECCHYLNLFKNMPWLSTGCW